MRAERPSSGKRQTRWDERTITVPTGKKSGRTPHPTTRRELKADAIRILDRSSNSDLSAAPEPSPEDEVPF